MTDEYMTLEVDTLYTYIVSVSGDQLKEILKEEE